MCKIIEWVKTVCSLNIDTVGVKGVLAESRLAPGIVFFNTILRLYFMLGYFKATNVYS